MSVMTQPFPPFALRHHRPVTLAMLALVGWVLAAGLVMIVTIEGGARSPLVVETGTVAAVVLSAYLYIRVCARCESPDHALAVGIAWLILSIGLEMYLTAHLGHGWFDLLGSPLHPLLRNLNLFLWVFAPSLFARRSTV